MLYEDMVLSYYKTEDAIQPLGAILLNDAMNVRESTQSNIPPHCFEITTPR